MTSVFRLIFDISVYYILTGMYLQAFCDQLPFVPGLVLLILALLLYGLCADRDVLKKGRSMILLFPLLFILFRPTPVQAIHFLPPFLYGSILLIKNLTDMDYKGFQTRLLKSFFLLLGSMVPLVLMAQPVFRLLGNLTGFLALAVFCGILCLRGFRDRDGGIQHLMTVSAFTATCAVLCLLNIPQKLLLFLRDRVLAGILDALERLFSLLPSIMPAQWEPRKEHLDITVDQSPKTEGHGFDVSGSYSMDEAVLSWLETFSYILLAIVLLVITVKLIIALLRSLKQAQMQPKQLSWKDEVVYLRSHSTDSKRRRRRKRARDPRSAVRYYYWRYMRECADRGIPVKKGWTAEDLGEASLALFPDADIIAMQELYNRVRYDNAAEVTPSHARQAAKLWQNFKKRKEKE